MSPARFDQLRASVPSVGVVGTPRAARWFAVALAAAALSGALGLLLAGEPLPGPGPTLALAIVIGVSVNRVAFFTSELSATAEAAVLFTAVVAFRADSPVLAPLVVALLVGPLDVLHWEQRAWVRMAYNSGSQGVAIAAGAPVFGAGWHAWGGTPAALLGAAGAGALVYVLVDSFCGVVLMRMLGGSSTRAAVRHQVTINGLGLPFALYGVGAATLALDVGWWAAFLALVPLPFVPELVLVQLRAERGAVPRRNALLAVELVAVLAVVACFSPVPDAATVCVLVAVALVVGAELVVDSGAPVAPVLTIVVVGVVLAVGRGDARFVGALVAGVATAVSWWCGADASRLRATFAVAFASCVGLVGAMVASADAHSEAGRLTLALAAMVVVLMLALLTVRRGRRVREASAFVWTAPFTALAFVGVLATGARTALLVGVGSLALATAVLVAAWCGATPWRSRFVSRRFGVVRGRGRTAVFRSACALAAGLGVAAVFADGLGADACAWAAFVLGESAVAMALAATRQWRFAPRARARDIMLLDAAALTLVVLFAAGLRHSESLAAVATVCLFGVVTGVGRASLTRADDAAAPIAPPPSGGRVH